MKFYRNDFLKNTNFLTMKFILCLQKVFTLMNIWMIGKNSMKLHYLKEYFYSKLNMEDIAEADYAHGKRVCKVFKVKNLGEYHDFHVQSDILLFADVFKNLRNMFLRIYELDPTLPPTFLTATRLTWQAALKKTKVKLDFIISMDMLLILEKVVRGGICHSIYCYAKANKKYVKEYYKNKELSYLQYWGINNLYGWAMLHKLSVNNFEWIEDISQFEAL